VARCDGLRSTADALARGTEPVIRMVIDQLFDIAEVATVLAEFGALFPSTRIDLKGECMDAVIRHVEAGCELGILASLATVPAHIASTVSEPIRLFPVAAADWPVASGQSEIDVIRTQGVQIVLGSRDAQPYGADFLVFGARTWRVEDITTKLALLRAGAGWGYMPKHIVEEDLASGRLRHLQADGLPQEDHQPVFILWQQNRQQGPAVRWLIQRFQTRDA